MQSGKFLEQFLALLLLVSAAHSAVVSDQESSSSCAVPKRASAQAALDELFTCLYNSRIKPTVEHWRSLSLDFGRLAGNGVVQPPLLKGRFTIRGLLASNQPGYRQFLDVIKAFNVYLGQDEGRGPAEERMIENYMRFLETSTYISDLFATLKANEVAAVASVSNVSQFVRRVLWDQWFKLYARSKKNHELGLRESSGFGHVMVGEVRASGVTGFHCWVQILLQEEAGSFDYKGYQVVEKESLVVGSIQFGWLNKNKPRSSFVFGVPPEFDLALYSASFSVNPGRKSLFTIDGKSIPVQTFNVNHQPESVGTAYVAI